MLWAMAFAEWTCAKPGCDAKVEWRDAMVIDDDRVIAVIHAEHVDAD